MGGEVFTEDGKCSLVASSQMGVTLFDLLDEIVSTDDLDHFLGQREVYCSNFGPNATIARFVLFLVDFATGIFGPHSISESRETLSGNLITFRQQPAA